MKTNRDRTKAAPGVKIFFPVPGHLVKWLEQVLHEKHKLENDLRQIAKA
jgi:hypothetical protein